MIAAGGEGEKVDLKIYLAKELNPASFVKGESTDHPTKEDC